MAGVDPIRVLVVHQSLLTDRDEAREVVELTAGLAAQAREAGDMEVLLSDGRRAYWLDLTGERPRPVDVGTHRAALRGADVVHVHMLLHWTHLLIAAEARVRGARVLFSPMSMLGRDFAGSSWFRDRSVGFRRVKPFLVRILRLLWLVVADVFVAASEEEVHQADLPVERTVLVPLVVPDSPLAAAAWSRPARPDAPPPDAPVMFLTRLDVHRKGIDRMCTWLEAEAARLPRPAVLLLAPSTGQVPAQVEELVSRGLLEWDQHSRGGDVLRRLDTCRAVMLLSRWDGQPRVLREAAVAGIPTISTASSHFAPVVRHVQAGCIVDGDAPVEIQRAFEAVRGHLRDPVPARTLLDRDNVGAYLHELVGCVARRRLPATRSYYEATRRVGG